MTVSDLRIQLEEIQGQLSLIPGDIAVCAAEVRFQTWNPEDLATISDCLSIPVSVVENIATVAIDRWTQDRAYPPRLGLYISYVDLGMVA